MMALFTGRPLVLNDDENKQADTIVNAWFAGSKKQVMQLQDVLYGKKSIHPENLPMTSKGV